MMNCNISLAILLFLLLISFNLTGQENAVYKLEKRLKQGDKTALFEIAPYFDSKNEIKEYLGWDIIKTTEALVSKRIVKENSLFMDHEIIISDSTTSKQFSDFLAINKNKIVFSSLVQAFLLTPLEKREVRFEIRELSERKKLELINKSSDYKIFPWVKNNKIEALIKAKNPKALLLIASEFYKRQYWVETLNEFMDLFELLTGTEIAVENENKELSWHIEKEYDQIAALNLLIFFLNHYKAYHWDDKNAVFRNPELQIRTLSKEELLFQYLYDENDSIAIDAFTQLTYCQPQKVIQLSSEYEKIIDFDINNAIPLFPFRFLKQMVILTDYCRDNNIDFQGSVQLKEDIKKLDADLSFSERRTLENKLINNLTLNEITAFEYWMLIHEESFNLTYSAGRILDIFYSKNWSQLLKNENQLKLYLKKSKLFDQLGIIGICNNYLKKFTNSDSAIVRKLNELQTKDNDIIKQIEKAKSMCLHRLTKPNKLKKEFEGNKDFYITDIEENIEALKIKINDSSSYEDKLIELLSKINYNQIGIALEAIESITFRDNWRKYSFMERDWGFFMLENFDSIANRKEFVKLYDKLSEYELYAYYLDKSGIDYKNNDKTLNYDKIYELLKYDVVVAFVGGGGGTDDNEVYSLIKLLEITHKTTLAYPHKLCNSNGTYACSSEDRAKEWMQYLIDNNLLNESHNEPVSFHYE